MKIQNVLRRSSILPRSRDLKKSISADEIPLVRSLSIGEETKDKLAKRLQELILHQKRESSQHDIKLDILNLTETHHIKELSSENSSELDKA